MTNQRSQPGATCDARLESYWFKSEGAKEKMVRITLSSLGSYWEYGLCIIGGKFHRAAAEAKRQDTALQDLTATQQLLQSDDALVAAAALGQERQLTFPDDAGPVPRFLQEDGRRFLL
jgi:hypothetical protein